MEKQFKLVRNGAFGSYYIENVDFVPEAYEIETFGVEEYYTDDVVFIGNIKELILFFVEYKKERLMKGWEVDKLSVQDLKWINNEAIGLCYQYKYLIGEVSEC